MLDTVNLTVFIASGLLLNITPGADVLFITSRGAAQGTRAGCIAALGIGTGGLVHILFAVFGLSAILATSAMAFTVIKFLGAGYLIFLGFSTLAGLRRAIGRSDYPATTLPPAQPLPHIFRQAILVNLLNPKVALFFLAFLPQFVAPQAEHPAATFLFLGCLFNVNGTIVNLFFALAAATIASRLRRGSRLAAAMKASIGLLFVWLGIRLALSIRH